VNPPPKNPPPEFIPSNEAPIIPAVVAVGVAVGPPATTALSEKFTVALGGTLIGGLKVNTVVLSGGVTVADAVLSPKVAVSVSELSMVGLLTVTVTVCSISVKLCKLV